MSGDNLVVNIKAETEVQRLLNAAIDGLQVTFEDIKETTENDKTLELIFLLNGQGELLRYFPRRDSLMILDSCFIFGGGIVISELLLHKTLKQIYIGHPKINKMKSLDLKSRLLAPNE